MKAEVKGHASESHSITQLSLSLALSIQLATRSPLTLTLPSFTQITHSLTRLRDEIPKQIPKMETLTQWYSITQKTTNQLPDEN